MKMLTKKDITAGRELLYALGQGGTVTPKAGTALAGLVDTLSTIGQLPRDGASPMDSNLTDQIMEDSNRVNSLAGSHSEVLEKVVGAIYEKAIVPINYTAKQVIVPMTNLVLERIESEQLSAETVKGNIPIIRQIEIPELVGNTLFQSLLAPYSQAKLTVDYNLRSIAVEMLNLYNSDADLLNVSVLGSASADKLSVATASNVRKLITTGLDAISGHYGINELCLNLDALVTTFIFCHGVVGGKGTAGKAASENNTIETAMKLVTATTGRLLLEVAHLYDSAVAYGDIIAPIALGESSRHTVIVIGSNYRRWLKESGGSPEVLLGWAISGANMSNRKFEDADEMAEYVKRYTTHMTSTKVRLEVETRQRIVSITRSTLARYIYEHPEYSQAEKIALQKKLSDTAGDIYGRKPGEYVRDVVASVFTEGTDALNLLREMDAVIDNLKTTDMTEEEKIGYARDIANITLIGHWIAEQIEFIRR